MPNTCCSVPGCSERGGHAFPKQSTRCKDWVVAIRRVNSSGSLWQPSKHDVVCHKHFTDTDYITETIHGTVPLQKKLKNTAVPNRFSWSSAPSPASAARMARAKRRRCSPPETMVPTTLEMEVGAEVTITEDSCGKSSKLVQTDTVPDAVVLIEKSTQTQNGALKSIENFRNDAKGVQYFTGLQDYNVFFDTLASLGPAAYKLNYLYSTPAIPIPDQLFLVIMKLRLYTPNFELARDFGLSESDVYNIFVTWIRFMSLQWQEIFIWPDQEVVRFFAPSDFKRKFPTTRVVVDGTECPIKKPKDPVAQQVTFSTYKNKNTAKVLIGVTPGGLISFVSPAYGGAASDRQIVERTNLVQMCDPGDSVMADKGFDVQDLFAPYDVTVNIPTFFTKKNRMSGSMVLRDRKISSKRVHVERVIGLLKTYKILKMPLNQTEAILSFDIIFVCCMMCNFRKCIVPRNA